METIFTLMGLGLLFFMVYSTFNCKTEEEWDRFWDNFWDF